MGPFANGFGFSRRNWGFYFLEKPKTGAPVNVPTEIVKELKNGRSGRPFSAQTVPQQQGERRYKSLLTGSFA